MIEIFNLLKLIMYGSGCRPGFTVIYFIVLHSGEHIQRYPYPALTDKIYHFHDNWLQTTIISFSVENASYMLWSGFNSVEIRLKTPMHEQFPAEWLLLI